MMQFQLVPVELEEETTLPSDDAAHTLSPVAGQEITPAICDSTVAANHLIGARDRGKVLGAVLTPTDPISGIVIFVPLGVDR